MVHRYHILPTLNLYRAKSYTTATRRTHSPSNLLNHVTIKPFHAAYRPAVHVCLCCAVTSTLDSDFPTATTSGSKSYLISTSFICMGRPRHVNPHHDEWKVFRHLPNHPYSLTPRGQSAIVFHYPPPPSPSTPKSSSIHAELVETE